MNAIRETDMYKPIEIGGYRNGGQYKPIKIGGFMNETAIHPGGAENFLGRLVLQYALKRTLGASPL